MRVQQYALLPTQVTVTKWHSWKRFVFTLSANIEMIMTFFFLTFKIIRKAE